MSHKEAVYQDPYQEKRKSFLNKTKGKAAAGLIAAGIALGGVGVWTVAQNSERHNPQSPPAAGGVLNPSETPFPTPEPIENIPSPTPDTSWISLLPQENQNNTIENVPLTEITKKQGIVSMVQNAYPSTIEYPYGYSISLQQETIVAVEPDIKNNSLWIALAISGDKLTREDTGQSVTNLDGTKTELYLYKGFTAWVEVLNSSVASGTDNQGQQGLSHIAPFLKIGDLISASISINQPEVFQQYQKMDLNTLGQLNNSVGQPSNRTDKKFKFKADFIFVNGIVK